MITEKRAYKRVPSRIKARFYCDDTDYSGTITNISEDGMFITTGTVAFPFESNLTIFIRRNEMLLKVPVRVCRLTKTGNVFNGIGVQVIDAEQDYLNFVKLLRHTRAKASGSPAA